MLYGLKSMSYDINVEGGSAIDVGDWAASLLHLGVRCAFDPAFVPAAWFGSVPVRLEVLDPTLFRGAERLHAAGTILASFEFSMSSVADDTPLHDLDARSRFIAATVAQLEALSVPSVVIDCERAKFECVRAQLAGARSNEPACALFSTLGSAANYVAAIYSAAALAQCTNGSLIDTYGGKTWTGSAILDAAARMVEAVGLEDEAFAAESHSGD